MDRVWARDLLLSFVLDLLFFGSLLAATTSPPPFHIFSSLLAPFNLLKLYSTLLRRLGSRAATDPDTFASSVSATLARLCAVMPPLAADANTQRVREGASGCGGLARVSSSFASLDVL